MHTIFTRNFCTSSRTPVESSVRISGGDTVLDSSAADPGFFTIPMARMVGETGRVIAVDVQEEMLVLVREAGEREDLAPRIQFHRSGGSRIGLDMPPFSPSPSLST